MGAVLDVRGGAGDEAAEEAKPAASAGRVLLLAVVILALAGAAIWLLVS